MSTRTEKPTLNPRDYVDRIRCTAAADLDSPEPTLHLLHLLHEAHMLTVPFENLSIHCGQPIVLQEAALFDKIVRRHRGGFCYELNGLFAWLLRSLGFEVDLLSAGVAQADGGFTPDFDHLTLRVHLLEGADWLADVGFGDSFRRPLRLVADVKQDGGDGHLYRVRRDDAPNDDQVRHMPRAYWRVERSDGAQWEAQYRFTLQPHTLNDFTERCQYQQTSPDSHFTQQRICSLALLQGRVSLSDLRLITTLQGKREERILSSDEEYRDVLAARFGIVI